MSIDPLATNERLLDMLRKTGKELNMLQQETDARLRDKDQYLKNYIKEMDKWMKEKTNTSKRYTMARKSSIWRTETTSLKWQTCVCNGSRLKLLMRVRVLNREYGARNLSEATCELASPIHCIYSFQYMPYSKAFREFQQTYPERHAAVYERLVHENAKPLGSRHFIFYTLIQKYLQDTLKEAAKVKALQKEAKMTDDELRSTQACMKECGCRIIITL
eukprot:TRINITY_DN7387_c0_g1_i1.p1 TRINITY_DN7387_c0_g1~~TRINITY_DN7387_c0_g1_i1.p1  ORF type:complete len:218 (+),score=23.48 TRINITY_DN7387_c0_g1_i1:176-829(+)